MVKTKTGRFKTLTTQQNGSESFKNLIGFLASKRGKKLNSLQDPLEETGAIS